MTSYESNVSHSNPQDQKLIYEFGKEMNFNIKQKGRKTNRDKSVIKILKSPAITASGISTVFSPSDPNELCDKLRILLQEKKTGKISDRNTDEIVALVDKVLKNKFISRKQHNFPLNKCLNWMRNTKLLETF